MNIKRYIDMAIRREIRRYADDEYKDLQVAVGKMISFLKAYKPKDPQQRAYIEKAIELLKRILNVNDSSMKSIERTHKRFDLVEKMLVRGHLFDKNDKDTSKLARLFDGVLRALMKY